MSTVLKDLTWENHKKAEATGFIKRLIKKEISPAEYYVYLANQLVMYNALEYHGDKLGIFDGLQDLMRTSRIHDDLDELEKDYNLLIPPCCRETENYAQYLGTISNDKNKILAHAYVRYMGDLSGGQIIKRFVPGSGTCYDFKEDKNMLKQKFASMVDETMADEANACFEMTIKFLNELEESLADSFMEKVTKSL